MTAPLTRPFMLDRARARDRAFDGVFLTCVRTTGIYCLPSCRARTPRPENVEHCASPAQAEARGYRPCRRCRPDDFHAGVDRDQQALLSAMQRVRSVPGDFAGVSALAAAAGCGTTKLAVLCKLHLHRTPADLLLGARLDHAQQALATSRAKILDVGLDAGFDSSSAFHANFRAHTGLTPLAYRRLLDGDSFALRLPPGHATAACLCYQARDQASGAERGDAANLHKALVLADRAGVLELRHRGAMLHCRVRTGDGRATGREVMAAAHRAVARMLRLDLDPAAGERALGADARLRPVVHRARGLRPWGTATPFECLLWAIVGQQVHLTFAQQLRAAVLQRSGTRIGDLVAHPEPGALLQLDAADLVALRFSRAKAGCLLGSASAIATGALDLAALASGAAGPAAAALQRLRGIGPWTAQYVLMRGILFDDCLPASDSALAGAAQQVFALPQRPGPEAVQQLAEPFAPHRSLLTFHLWRAAAAADSGARIRKKTEPVAACSTS